MSRTHSEKKRLTYHIQLIVTVLLNLAILLWASFMEGIIFFALAAVGIVTFFGILIVTNTASEDPEFSTGEMRKAIASCIVIFYLVSGSLFLTSKANISNEVISNVITPFSWVLGSVIAFYFGNTALSKFLEERNKSQAAGDRQPPTS